MGDFLRFLGEAVERAGGTVGDAFRQKGERDFQKQLEEEREKKRQAREEDEQAYERIQQMLTEIRRMRSSGALQEGSQVYQFLAESEERLSSQGISGASQLLGQLNSDGAADLLGLRKRQTGQQGGVRPDVPAYQGPDNLGDALATAGVKVDDFTRNRGLADMTFDSVISVLSAPGTDAAFRQSFAQGWVQAQGDKLDPALRDTVLGMAGAQSAVRPASAIVDLSNDQLALEYGQFFNPDGSLKPDAPAELVRANAGGILARRVEQGRRLVSHQNAMMEFELTDTENMVQLHAAELNIAELESEDFANEIIRRAERHEAAMSMNEVQREQLEQAIEHAGVDFADSRRDQAMSRVLRAAEVGSDFGLNGDEKKVLASYLNTTVGSKEYVDKLGLIAEQNLDMAKAIRARAEIDTRAAEVGVNLQEQQLSAAEYAQARAERLDPLNDASQISTAIYDAASRGDVALLERYRMYLDNPDAYPAQARALADAGVTLESLETDLELASDVRKTGFVTREESREQLEAQTQSLLNANLEDGRRGAVEFARNFKTVEEWEAYRNNPANRGLLDSLERANPEAYAYIEADIAFRQAAKDEERAFQTYQTLAASPPSFANPAAPTEGEMWALGNHLTNLGTQLEAMGFTEAQIAAQLEAHREAIMQGATDRQLHLLTSGAKLSLLQAQTFAERSGVGQQNRALGQKDRELDLRERALNGDLDAAQIEADAAAAQAEIDALSEMRQSVNQQMTQSFDGLVGAGCAVPVTIDGVIGKEVAEFMTDRGRTAPECTEAWEHFGRLSGEMELIRARTASWTALADAYAGALEAVGVSSEPAAETEE